jgi:hypothetical protein
MPARRCLLHNDRCFACLSDGPNAKKPLGRNYSRSGLSLNWLGVPSETESKNGTHSVSSTDSSIGVDRSGNVYVKDEVNAVENAEKSVETVPTEMATQRSAPHPLQTVEKSVQFDSDLTLVKGFGERRAAQLTDSASTASTN